MANRLVRRFQTAKMVEGWSWAGQGPDLLRDRDGAVRFLNEKMADAVEWWERQQDKHGGWTVPDGPMTERQALQRVETWNPDFDRQVIQFGRKEAGKLDWRYAVKGHDVTVKDYPGATDRAELTWALYDRAFPATEFGGIFACKPYSHGYGDATDVSYGDTVRVFDWGLRMSKAGFLVCEQIIGTQDGRTEVTAWRKDGYAVGIYKGNGSHLWHVHHGCGHATDAKPPCL